MKAVVNLDRDVVEGFVSSVLSARFDGASESAGFHRECWDLCTGKDKYVAIAAPRGHAKSSAITFGYGLATLVFRERKFMLIVSDTESQAAGFVGMFRAELQENKSLIDLFDLKLNDKGEVQFVKDSETDIIVEMNDGHRFRVLAKGSEQKLRGLLWNGSRPDIIMCDDVENDELVMNKDRRTKFKNWFQRALLPCLSDRGIVRLVGTVLHMDSLLEGFMPNPSDRSTITVGLKQYSKYKRLWRAVKYKAHNEDFTELLWPEKKSKELFLNLYEEARRDGTLDSYSQEYLNVPLDESNAFYQRSDFLPIKDEAERDQPLNYYITGDLAISESEKADYSVFIVAGVTAGRIIHIRDVIRERLNGKEIVDTMLRLQQVYDPVAFGLEEMQVSKSIRPFLYEEMVKTNTYINLEQLKTNGKDKPFRSRSMQARMRAHGVRFDKDADWYATFEDELLTFPRGRKDDQADAFAYVGLMLDKLIEAPSREEQKAIEYELELEESGLNNQGQSEWTGY